MKKTCHFAGFLYAILVYVLQPMIGHHPAYAAQLFQAAQATDLGGAALNANGGLVASQAHFYAELLSAGIYSKGGALLNTPGVTVLARISVAPGDVGQNGEIIVVSAYQGHWYMLSASGWQAWDLNVQSLAAAAAPRPLSAVEDFEVVSGLTLTGDFTIYLGYRRAGLLHFSPTPLSFSLVPMPKPVLNDTGIGPNQCFQAGSDVLVSCSSAAAKSLSTTQDGMLGRDADPKTNKADDGALGFRFIKVCRNGEPAGYGACPANPVLGGGEHNWGCTLDVNALVLWEVKTDDGGLHDGAKTYTNYSPDYNPDNLYGSATDASGFVKAVNTENLCGFNDWQLASVEDLTGLVHYGVKSDSEHPAIETAFFPNMLKTDPKAEEQSSLFHTSTPLANTPGGYAWRVDFGFQGIEPRRILPRATLEAKKEKNRVLLKGEEFILFVITDEED